MQKRGFQAARRRVTRQRALIFTCLLCALGAIVPAEAAALEPNILFIVTDDQRLSQANGVNNTMDVMPKTKGWFQTGRTLEDSQTFDGGTFFPNGIANSPLCCPARASLFSGRYAHNNGLDRNPDFYYDPKLQNYDQDATIQAYLQAAGYRTAIFGKFFNEWNLTTNPAHWDDWAVHNKASYSPTVVNDHGTVKWIWRHSTNFVRDKAVNFLQETHDTDPSRPWFLYVAPSTPHGPFAAEPRFATDPVPSLQETPAYFEADRTDKPKWVRTGYTDADDVKAEWPIQLRMLKSADELVDDVMRKVAALGEDRDTIAVFVSDNGYSWGEHGRRAKPNPYRENVHVPYYLRWPNSPTQAGKPGTDARMANLVDLAPTAIDAVNAGGASISPSPAMDGMSLVSPAQQARSHAFMEMSGVGPPILIQGSPSQGFCNGIFPTWNSVLTPSYHYIEYYQTYWTESSNIGGCAVIRQGQPVDHFTNFSNITFREYYDLTQDPDELTNLLGDNDPDNDPPTAQLEALLTQDRQCQGQSCIPQSGDPAQVPVDVAINRHPDANTSATTATFAFAATEPAATFGCRQGSPATIGSLPFTPCTSPRTYSNLADGAHVFEVRATAGSSTDTASYSWNVGSGFAPDTAITAKPPNPALTRSATFQFTGTSQLGGFECRAATSSTISSTAWSACSSPFNYLAPSDGTFSFEVRSTDTIGGPDTTPAAYSWTIDTAAPETTFSDTPPATTHSPGANFSFSASETAAGLECKLDAAPDWTQCTSTKGLRGLSEGSHTFRVRAKDTSGNADPTPATFTWTVGILQTFSNSPDPTWPEISEGTEVRAVASDGVGGWYVGGDFTKVRDGTGDHDHVDVVHINANKTVDDNWRPATVDGAVRSLVTSGGVVYVGGSFTSVKGNDDTSATPRNRLAAFNDAASAAAVRGKVTSWNPDADADVNALAIGTKKDLGTTTTTSNIYAAGAFQNVGGATRSKVVELDLTNGTPTSWSAAVPSGIDVFALQVTSLSLNDCAEAGCGKVGNVYVGGGTTLAGAPGMVMEIDRATGQVTNWQPDPDGTVYSLKVGQNQQVMPTLFVGGVFNSIGPTSVARAKAAELNLSDDGSVTSFDPSPSATGGTANVRDFMPLSCAVVDPNCRTIFTGFFTSLGSTGKNMLAEVDPQTGVPNSFGTALSNSGMALSCYPTSNCDQQANGVLAVGGRFMAPRKLLAFYGKLDSSAATADLRVTNSDSPDPVNVNSLLTYTVTVHNSGPSGATSVRITDELPSAVTYQSATPSQGTCSQAAGVVTCELGALAASGSASVDIVVRPLVDGQLSNRATVSGKESEPTPLDNAASQTTAVNANSYARPKGATPMIMSVVPAFSSCATPNRSHTGPLSYGACNPAAAASGNLTVGTPDANGAPANMMGNVRVDVCPVPGCVAPDVRFQASVGDVRCDSGPVTCAGSNSASGPDYTGELRTRLVLRITDKYNGPALNEGATVTDAPVFAPLACTATASDPARGSNCSALTTLNALLPGTAVAGKHAIWELQALEVTDGGIDGDAESAADNELFLRPGLLLP